MSKFTKLRLHHDLLLSIANENFNSARRLLLRNYDEMSILFETEAELEVFVRDMRERGLWFNESQEQQHITSSNSYAFGTDFQFVWPYQDAPYRIEAMRVTDGYAPLHERHLSAHGSPSTVHASWKLPNMAMYSFEKERLAEEGFQFHQEYRNNYGIFSYWSPRGTSDAPTLFYKPRVNTRD